MKILMVDDELEVRFPIFKKFVNASKNWFNSEFSGTTFVPETFVGYDYVSFDNDLGQDKEVVRELKKRMYEDFDGFVASFKGVQGVFIHSMNNIAAREIFATLKDAFPTLRISIVPFDLMIDYTKGIKDDDEGNED